MDSAAGTAGSATRLRDPRVARIASRYRGFVDDETTDPHDWAYAWRAELNRGGFHAVYVTG